MIQIMKASAGSGKTFSLARKYITLLFKSSDPYAYRHILAVTFTNKATSEMKNRILKELYILSTDPLSSGYLKWFIPEMFSPEQMEGVESVDIVRDLPGHPGEKISAELLKSCARALLCNILHDYSAFSVSTIDRFFQQTLRAFSREIGQFDTYQVELDDGMLIGETVDRIFDSLSEEEPRMLDWLTSYVREQVESEGKFDLDEGLTNMAGRLKSDAYRSKAEACHLDEDTAYSQDNLQRIRTLCRKILRDFPARLSGAAQAAIDAIRERGLDYGDFSHGFPKYFEKYLNLKPGSKIDSPGSHLLKAADENLWFNKANQKKFMPMAAGLQNEFSAFLSLFGDEYKVYNTAKIIDGQLYELGIFSDIRREFEAVLKERNVLSIDDSNLLLKNIIDGSDAPFVYEKTGVRYENFLLDEFQDTSNIQWENFRPLLENSQAQNCENLVVGDVKQSIYRWRDSDWKLLQDTIGREFPRNRTTVLDTNFRSLGNIVRFNNSFFTYAAEALDRKYGSDSKIISSIYSDVCQKARSEDGGLVEAIFCQPDEENDKIVSIIAELAALGVRYSDIAVLVRTGAGGTAVAQRLIEEGIPVITDESLYVKNSPKVNMLVSMLTCIDNTYDTVGGWIAAEKSLDDIGNYHSLSDLCETLIRRLKDEDPSGFDAEATYIYAFADAVLEYSTIYGNSLHAFLEYWNSDKVNPSVSSPDDSDAVRILTVHKSKGLDFGYVIFPFAEKVELYKSGKVWCHPDFSGTSLDPIGDILFDVKLGENTLPTLFAADYKREMLMQYIDNLNVFYVALTRAVRAMYIISKTPSKTFLKTLKSDCPTFSTMSDVLYAYLDRYGVRNGFRCEATSDDAPDAGTASAASDESDSSKTYILGSPTAISTDAAKTSSAQIPAAYPSFELNPSEEDSVRKRLVFSTDNEDYFSEDGSSGLYASGRVRGVILHKILSSVEIADDLETAVNEAVASNLISRDDAVSALDLLSAKLSSVASRGWFSSEAGRILNEASLIDIDGQVYRPDRVLISPDGSVTVIDYKFGEKAKSHQRQIRKYAQLWRQMGHSQVSAWLWYLTTDEILEVE